MAILDGVEVNYVFSIHNDDHKLVVGIHHDGRVDIGPGATGVDDAAMMFYQAVAEIVDRMDFGETFEAPPAQKPS
jgi:hypothetical protein